NSSWRGAYNDRHVAAVFLQFALLIIMIALHENMQLQQDSPLVHFFPESATTEKNPLWHTLYDRSTIN
ncbi:MAG: hypothetical protein LUP95_00575, partial [Euryarchaeota archaeon]|nr:hypothetical protein [Euryarchaeota archaeon]